MLEVFEDSSFNLPFYPDIFYTPEYLQIFSRYTRDSVFVFYFENDKGRIISPFIKRKIPFTPFFDISTPYGYSGLFVESDNKYLFIKEFYKELKVFLLDNKIISEFVRIHPHFFDRSYFQDFFILHLVTINVFIDLREEIKKIEKNIRKGHMADIKRAIREGVEIKISREDKDIEIFHNLYIETMKRKRTSEFYFFPLWMIKELISCFKDSFIFVAFLKETPIASSLFLGYKRFFHYFLSGSSFDYRKYRGTHLIIYEAIKFAKEKGFEVLHFGGGMKERDDLFLFKSGFSNLFLPYYVYGVIHNEKVYNDLVEERRKKGPLPDNFFFPLYRAPL